MIKSIRNGENSNSANGLNQNINRRSFLWRMAILSASATLPLSCSVKSIPKIAMGHDPNILSIDEWNLLIAVQDILLPTEKNAPGAREINAAAFVQWVISDPELDPDERKALKDGIKKVNDEAIERWELPFLQMKEENRQKLLRHIETHSWGEHWLAKMLLYIFEALLGDPIYGCNPEGIGWKWLNHDPGQPRPKLTYNEQLAVIRKPNNL